MTVMDVNEMSTVLEVVAACWPAADTERRTAAGYRLLVGDCVQADVLAVIHDLAMEGREFPPPPGLVAQLATRRANQKLLAAAASGELAITPDKALNR